MVLGENCSMYIGGGVIVLILIILLVLFLVRRSRWRLGARPMRSCAGQVRRAAALQFAERDRLDVSSAFVSAT